MPIVEAPIAIQMIVGPRPSRRTTRVAKNEPISDPMPPAETTIPSTMGSRCSSLIRNSVYSTP